MLCDSWIIDLNEHARSRVHQSIATDCRTFWPCRPLSTAYCFIGRARDPSAVYIYIGGYPTGSLALFNKQSPCHLPCTNHLSPWPMTTVATAITPLQIRGEGLCACGEVQ